jgi:oxygen-dependent protoporphyrinogen oxidase
MGARHVVIVGGGITGLAAALEASGQADTKVTLVEASPTLGGKLAVGSLDGVTIDLGAESLLNTRPEAVDLVREVGLGDALVHPATAAARLLSRGALRPIPAGLVMGAPADLDAVVNSSVLDDAAVAELQRRFVQPIEPLTHDTGIGAFVGGAVGDEVAERLVDPILAGVYAGDAFRISLQAAAPTLYAAAQKGGAFAAVTESARRTPSGPVFAGIVGGVGSLPEAVGAELRRRGVTILTSTVLDTLSTDGQGTWQATVRTIELEDDGATGPPRVLDGTEIVLAVPAFAASTLLSTLPARRTPGALFDAMRALDAIPYADVAVLSFAFPLDAMPGTVSGSGFLIPSVEGRFIKASTFSSNKWEWLGDSAAARGRFVLRASVGRFGESVDELIDDQLIDRAFADLREILPGLPAPTAVRVDRWQQSLPQYLVGHTDRVARVRTGVAALPGLSVAGAAYDGIGIAACIASGRRAVTA